MLQHRRRNLTGWLQTLLSSSEAGRTMQKCSASKGRKMILESLETRRVFDAGWASTMDNTFTSAMDGDNFGNQYVTGATVASSTQVKTFENLNVVDANNNLFVAKQNANGQFLWTSFAGNTTSTAVSSRAIAADNNGGVFVVGRFSGIATFGSQSLTSVGDYDGFVAKLNASNGQFLWARQFGGAGKDLVRGVEVDLNGNIVVTGGLGMSASAVNDAPIMFITKMDTNGSTLWSKSISGDSSMTGSLESPVFDSTGAMYVGGRFQGTVDLPTGSLSSQGILSTIPSFGPTDGLVAKLDSNGNFLWGRSLSGDETEFVTDLTMGPSGELYASGTLSGTMVVDGIQLVGSGGRDGFVARINTSTGAVVWANQMGGTGEDFLSKLSVNANGDVYAVGTFEAQAGFGSQSLVTDGKVNAFVAKISPAGQFLVASRFLTGTTSPYKNVTNTPSIKGLHIDSAGELIVFGSVLYGGDTAWTGVQAPQKPITARLSSMTYIFDFVVKLPPIAPTKFYVVDDSNRDRTYQYGSNGELTVDNFSINEGNTSPRGAASNAAGTTVWVGDRNKNVYVYRNNGVLQGAWTAGSLPLFATVEGVTTNGTDVWIVDNASDRVYRYTGAASRVSGSQNAASNFKLNSANSNPKGIVTDGTHVWVLNDSSTDRIFKYTVGGSFLGSWTIDSTNKSPTGLTIDPTNGSQSIWVVDNGTDRIYEYANARGRNSGGQSASATYALAVGNTNPQGIADPPPPNSALPTSSVETLNFYDASATNTNLEMMPTHVAKTTVETVSSSKPWVISRGIDAIMSSLGQHQKTKSIDWSDTAINNSKTPLISESTTWNQDEASDENIGELVHQLATDLLK